MVRRLSPGVHGGVWRVTHELKNDMVKEPLERFPALTLILGSLLGPVALPTPRFSDSHASPWVCVDLLAG